MAITPSLSLRVAHIELLNMQNASEDFLWLYYLVGTMHLFGSFILDLQQWEISNGCNLISTFEQDSCLIIYYWVEVPWDKTVINSKVCNCFGTKTYTYYPSRM